MQDIRPSSWTELQEALFEGAWNTHLGRHRLKSAFHGSSDCRYELVTSLQRLGGDVRDVEHHLLRNFRKYAHQNVTEGDSMFYWLAVGQHYGLPTRLIDWTYSPFVALHFATANPEQFGHDGAVWVVDYAETNAHLPEALRQQLAGEGSDVFTVEMLTRFTSQQQREGGFNQGSLAALEAAAPDPFLLFFEPPSLDERIVQQFALFSMLSQPDVHFADWLQRRPGSCRRVIIPAELKWEVRDKLDQANITERTLFPGLAGLSTWLKRYYSPREGWQGSQEDHRHRP